MKDVKLEQFEGPLDLLLQLIEEAKLPINDIALVQVTEQYSRLVYENPSIPLEELADYLVVVSKLLLLKSRTLVPQLEAAESDGMSLAEQLKMYERYHAKTRAVEALWNSLAIAFPRPKPPREWMRQFRPPQLLHPEELTTVMRFVIRAIVPPKTFVRQMLNRALTVQSKIKEFIRIIGERLSITFSGSALRGSRAEAIVGFLALLELVKRQIVDTTQEQRFGDIIVRRSSS